MTVAHWQSVVRDIEGRLATERSREEKLLARKKAIALKASLGDAPATKMLGAYNRELIECRGALEDLEAAAEQATGMFRAM